MNKASNHGDVSLMCTAMKGDEQWISSLIKEGADVNKVNKLGETAFTIANNKNYEQCVTILTTEGADVNTPDLRTQKLANEDKTTKQMVGTEEEETDAIKFLCINLDRGCDLSTPPAGDPWIIPTNGEIPQPENRD